MGNWGAPAGVLLPHGVRGAGHGLHKQGPRLLLPGPQCCSVWRSQQEVLRLPCGESSLAAETATDCIYTSIFQRGNDFGPVVLPQEYISILNEVGFD